MPAKKPDSLWVQAYIGEQVQIPAAVDQSERGKTLFADWTAIFSMRPMLAGPPDNFSLRHLKQPTGTLSVFTFERNIYGDQGTVIGYLYAGHGAWAGWLLRVELA